MGLANAVGEAVLSLTMIIRVATSRSGSVAPGDSSASTPEPDTRSSGRTGTGSVHAMRPLATRSSSAHRMGNLMVLAVRTLVSAARANS